MKNASSLPPEQTVADLAHLAWCALMALRLAQQDGQASSPLAAHTFLLRWLAGVQKHKRFPRSVVPDIEALLSLGRRKGSAAGLPERLDYLWTSCSEPVSVQSDLYRLTYALEQLKSRGWVNTAVSDDDWNDDILAQEYHGTATLLVNKSALTRGFSEEGKLLLPVEFRVSGETAACMAAFQAHALHAVSLAPDRITLLPEPPTGE